MILYQLVIVKLFRELLERNNLDVSFGAKFFYTPPKQTLVPRPSKIMIQKDKNLDSEIKKMTESSEAIEDIEGIDLK